MPLQMHVVNVDTTTEEIVGIARLIRLAKHVDGRLGIVDREDNGNLFVKPLELFEGEARPMKTIEKWTPVNVSEANASPSDQPGVVSRNVRGFPVDKDIYAQVQSSGMSHPQGGKFRFKLKPNNILQEQVDDRPVIKFRVKKLKAPKSSSKTKLTVDHVSDSSFTGTLEMVVQVGKETKNVELMFSEGVAKLDLDKKTCRNIRIDTSEFAVIQNGPVELVVLDTEI